LDRFNIFPHGLSLGQGTFRPAMIFKNKQETEVLPVWLDSYEANVLLTSSQIDPRESSPHKASLKVLESLGVVLESIYFNEVTNSTQYAEVSAIQDKKNVKVRVRAAEAMSLALKAGCSFFTNKDVVEKSRTLNFQMVLHENAVNPKDIGALH
jgi:bifunctional DNase/RNase